MRFPDTRHYWSLTRHIFRYGHRGATDAYNGAHTINEGKQAAALPAVLLNNMTVWISSRQSRGLLGTNSLLYEVDSER
jgi:hypothetical protein